MDIMPVNKIAKMGISNVALEFDMVSLVKVYCCPNFNTTDLTLNLVQSL